MSKLIYFSVFTEENWAWSINIKLGMYLLSHVSPKVDGIYVLQLRCSTLFLTIGVRTELKAFRLLVCLFWRTGNTC